jgi:hypothetical protein
LLSNENEDEDEDGDGDGDGDGDEEGRAEDINKYHSEFWTL